MGQRLATSSKTNFATSETTIPLPLLTKFNSMINLFRANLRRAKKNIEVILWEQFARQAIIHQLT